MREGWMYDSEMGGYVNTCDRCGTARGVRSNGLCDPCARVWDEPEECPECGNECNSEGNCDMCSQAAARFEEMAYGWY